jgi:hypothetical protein
VKQFGPSMNCCGLCPKCPIRPIDFHSF